MTVDPEQVRRDAEELDFDQLAFNARGAEILRDRFDALLAELEQAERQLAEWKDKAFDALSLSRKANDNCEWMDGQLAAIQEREAALEAQLAVVPALVETLKHVLSNGQLGKQSARRLREALAAYEQAQEQR